MDATLNPLGHRANRHALERLPGGRTVTDTLRDRIVQVQAEHVEGQLTNYDADGREECGCGHQGNATYREHLADAILAIPGIAVVELPSFDSIEDDFGVVDNKVRHYLPSGFGAYREYRLNDARDLAAALLAAADHAERDQ
jgi:hypothetical protein